MTRPNWADLTAAQILIIAYSDPEARERIADVLRLVRGRGHIDGINDAQQIFNAKMKEQAP